MSRPGFDITREVLEAHRRWLKLGAGPGRLVVAGRRIAQRLPMGEDLSGSSFTDCELADGDISVVAFDRAEFVGCDLHGCEADTTSFQEATITSCTFTDVRLVTAFFDNARVTGCVFRTGAGAPRRMTIARTGWQGARVTDCHFENVHFDLTNFGAGVFERCAFTDACFRQADFIKGTVFRDCDFTRVDFTQVDFAGGHFERCRGLPSWVARPYQSA